MSGYGFVDNIQARKRQEKRLEEELARRNARQARMDDIVYEDQRFQREDRQRLANFRERGREAAAIMASPNPNLEVLGKDYSDIPGVLDFIEKGRLQGHLETGFAGDPNYQAPAAGGLANQAQAAADPNAPGTMTVNAQDQTMGVAPVAPEAGAMTPDLVNSDLTADQINEQVQTGAISEAEGRRLFKIREQNALFQPFDSAQRALNKNERDRRRRAQKKAGETISAVDNIAEAFVDLGDNDGDVYRDWSPGQATEWYHDNRENVSDPVVRQKLDSLMEDRVLSNMEASRAIMLDDNIDTASSEFRNAERKFAESLGLADAMAIERNPAELVGADSRGVSRRNTAMVEGMITEAGKGRQTMAPGSPDRHRANMTIALRGNNSTRIGKKYQNAAYGLLANGVIDINTYATMMRSGAPLGQILASQGIDSKIVQGSPDKDTFIEYKDPVTGLMRRDLIIPARKVLSASEMEERYRNTWGGDAVNHLYNHVAKTMNTENEPKRGERLVNTFLADLAGHEATARANGYSFQNRNDAMLLFRRYSDMHVMRDVYNREVSDSWWRDKPTFSQAYGNIETRIFDRNFDQQMQGIVEEHELETASGNQLRLTPLKEVGGAEIEWLRDQFPDQTRRLSDAQIAEIVRSDEQSLGR